MHRLRFTGSIDRETFERKCAGTDFWYHSFYFDNGFSVRGAFNIGADIDDYGFPDDMTGMKVLDIGAGSGWFSFYFAEKGAEVTSVDVRGYCDFDTYGRASYPDVSTEKSAPDRVDENGNPIYHGSVNEAFWIIKDMLGTDLRFRNARAYEIRPELFDGETFDLVFIGALLLHLRDPIGALMAARTVCSGQLMATTPVGARSPEDETTPLQYLPYTDVDPITWWVPNALCYRHWFLAAGFSSVEIDREVSIHGDEELIVDGRVTNEDQILRLGVARV